ncbi:hypothetical protein L211DRAFT_866468 [Terfezia boudieri ATCC MYA-4762]|uniref:Uncharacterized protein n=1 Tax=Terfezia boudieri ATCC MYA-4762 TaxID=1051890 RepID=A0A3N4LUL0_9PEZI|nr:hypothetical protein L211DRAFT_866468 [Terfezia boudieri ATCC MYA-4762]
MEGSAVSRCPLGSPLQLEHQNLQEHYVGEKRSDITVETSDITTKTSTDDESTSALQARQQPTRRTCLKRFGPCAVALFVIILLLISLPVLAISLIWFQEDFSPRTMLIRGNAVPQFAATATGVLRVGILLLSGICTPIIASLVLRDRQGGVPLRFTTGFSLLRFSRSDPIFLVSEFISAMKYTKPAVRRRFLKYFLLAVVLFITTILFQFSGTLLLMDMQPRYVPDTAALEHIPMWSQNFNDQAADTANVWYTRPLNIIPFAQDKPDTAPNMQDGWDTGKTMRGFLPFDSMLAGNSIQNLQGPLPVFDAQYACFRPTSFSASLSRGTYSGHTSFYLAGSTVADAAQGGSVPQSWGSRVESTFICTFPTRGTGNDVKPEDTPIGLCEATLKPGTSGNDPSKVYLVLKVDGTLPEWESYYSSMSNSTENASIDMHMLPNTGWMELSNFEGGNIRLAATICYTKHSLQLPPHSTIKREAPLDQPAPQIAWDSIRGRYNTDNIREFFTSDPPPYTLSLDTSASATATEKFDWLIKSLSLQGSAIFCISCDYSSENAIKVDNLKSTLTQDTLRVTENPALMLQTLFTILFQESYSQSTPMYDSLEELTVTRFVTRQSPEGCTGYTIVVGVLIFYVFVVGGLMLAFVSWTMDSLWGDAWSAVIHTIPPQEQEKFCDKTLESSG